LAHTSLLVRVAFDSCDPLLQLRDAVVDAVGRRSGGKLALGSGAQLPHDEHLVVLRLAEQATTIFGETLTWSGPRLRPQSCCQRLGGVLGSIRDVFGVQLKIYFHLHGGLLTVNRIFVLSFGQIHDDLQLQGKGRNELVV
jgi:hypothetical protein